MKPAAPLAGIVVALCIVIGLLAALALRQARRRCAARAPAAAAIPAKPPPLAGVIVILDPGHGGADPGVSVIRGRLRVDEAALTYRTALELARLLRAAGADVRYTVLSKELRDDSDIIAPIPTLPTDAILVSNDRPLAVRIGRSPRQLWERAAVAQRVWAKASRTDANAARDVFFLSLHYDEFHTSNVHGGLVCVDRRAAAPARIGVALARSLAAHGWSRPDATGGQRGLSRRRLGVLNPKFNPVPQSALLEIATLSNINDYFHATDPAWRGQVEAAIAQAIEEVHAGQKSPDPNAGD